MQGLSSVKHVALYYHYVRSILELGSVEIIYLPKDKIRADQVTKIFGSEIHANHRRYFVAGTSTLLVRGAC